MDNTNKIAHLEMIQGCINRMAKNSFMIKGWSVALAVLIFAVAADQIELWHCLLLVVPTMMFATLDAYYLMLERRFVAMYKTVTQANEEDVNFDINPLQYKIKFGLAKAFISHSIWLFYSTLLIIEAVGIIALFL